MMELPADVLIHNETLGVKGGKGVLIQVNPEGYYEVNCFFGDQPHRTYFPIQGTVLIAVAPEEVLDGKVEVER